MKFWVWFSNKNISHIIFLTWKTFFLENHAQNVLEKLVQDTFIQNENWAYLWISSLKCYTICFSCMSKDAPVSSKKFLDIQATTECRFTLKRVCNMIRTNSLELVFLTHFLHSFWRKLFPTLNSTNWTTHAITCPFSKHFQILYILVQIFKYFALFKHFFTLLLKNLTHALTF